MPHPRDIRPITPPKTLGDHFRKALRESNAWRPVSFYMLLAIPLVMFLAAHMIDYREHPARFAGILSLLFIFFGIVVVRAVMDMFEISRRSMRARREAWNTTLGDAAFLDDLRARRETPPQ